MSQKTLTLDEGHKCHICTVVTLNTQNSIYKFKREGLTTENLSCFRCWYDKCPLGTEYQRFTQIAHNVYIEVK